MKANRKRFDMEDYRDGVSARTNAVAYYQDIANFLTTLGPSRVISVQTPGHRYISVDEITDIWYWEK